MVVVWDRGGGGEGGGGWMHTNSAYVKLLKF